MLLEGEVRGRHLAWRLDGFDEEAEGIVEPHDEVLADLAVLIGGQGGDGTLTVSNFSKIQTNTGASGTVTLELALAGVPMIGAYRAGPVEMWIALTLAFWSVDRCARRR